MPSTRTELPWRVQLTAHPLMRRSAVDVVQAGLLVGLRAIEGVRKLGLPVGPVLCCHVHSFIHIPVELDTAYRWHAPQTVCRTGVWDCAVDKAVAAHSRCSGVWLLSPDREYVCTDSAALLHWLALTRSTGARNWTAPYGS